MLSNNQKAQGHHITARVFKGSPFIVDDVAVCNSLKVHQSFVS